MINWKDPVKEMPASGSQVWILIRHRTRDDLLSCEIVGVEVWEKVNKEQYFINSGYTADGTLMQWRVDDIAAWAVVEDINLPERT